MTTARTLALGQALDDNASLAQLLARVQAARQRLAVVHAVLPPGMQASVRAGPLDDTGWTLLTDGNASAAKLRNWLPQLQQRLIDGGFADLPLRVKVLPRPPGGPA